MGCRSDHMDPTPLEIQASILYSILDEVAGRPVRPQNWAGSHPSAYGKGPTRETVDMLCQQVCDLLKRDDTTTRSPQVQAWWAKHQDDDERRLLQARDHLRDAEAALKRAQDDVHAAECAIAHKARRAQRAEVLAKLTSEEIELLGIKP